MYSSSFSSSLAAIYPPGRLLTAPVQLLAYESDALTAFRQRPRAVVLADSQDEVIRTVRLCHQAGVPFVARGSGTSLSGGSLPIEDGIVIALNRLNRIKRLDPEQRLAVVETGVVNQQITQAADPHGLYYAPDPSSQPVCTIGGNIAFNSGGAHCLKYGMTSNHILGLRVVLADGEVVEFGSESAEGVSVGPDWVGLFVGSEGLFGIALEATVRLVPKPEHYRTVLAAYGDLATAGEAVAAVVASGLLPAAIEIMDRLAIEAAEAAVHAGYPGSAEAVLIVELDGEVAQVEREFEHLQRVIERSGASEIRIAQSAEQRLKIWKGRKGAFSAVGRLSPDYVVQDGVVPRGQLGRALAEIGRLSGEYGLRVANVFHAGDGNLHPLILYDGKQHGALERAEELAGKIVQLCIELGGTITGEHGVGMEKRRYMTQLFQPVDLQTMRRIRRQLDPLEIANRGKMFPDDGSAPTGTAAQPAAESAGTPRPAALHAAAIDAVPAPSPSIPTVFQPQTAVELQEMVLAAGPWRVRGGGSKPALSAPLEGTACLEMSRLAGMIEYVPDEYAFTAYAGTPLLQVVEELARHGQYLPFDPLLIRRGATLGGTVAANTSGSGRYRYGGVRDFILGVQFVDGCGQLVRGGGKVVKNAAGFDLPKFFVGSLGRYGILAAISFKVFPRPRSYLTWRINYPNLAAAQQALFRLATQPFEIDALDLESGEGEAFGLCLRLGGIESGLADRLARLQAFLQSGPATLDEQFLQGEDEAACWEAHNSLRWVPAGAQLIKVPLAPRQLPELNARLRGSPRRYAAGGHVAWIATQDVAAVNETLTDLGLVGLRILGPTGNPYLGARRAVSMAERLKRALDPLGRFGEA